MYLSRYGGQLEADFAQQYPGYDLRELWQSRQWRRLLNLIDELRRPSRFHEAVALDEEHVDQIEAAMEQAGRSEPEASRGPQLREYGTVEERLDTLIDAVNHNTAATVAAAGAKPPRVTPAQRPETAFDKVRHRRRAAQHDALVGRLTRSRKRSE